MKKFFNIIVSGSTATIFLYGDIGNSIFDNVHSGTIARELKEAEAAYKNIEVRINSMGGDVYAGIAIFNAFRNSNANIKIFVDGIAASMASVIALCGKPVEMSKYARLMLHSISGGCYGTKKDLKDIIEQIDVLEGTLADMYAKKTNMTVEKIKSSYFDGTDHYLTADEALSLGFIDGVYDAEPVPEDSTPEQIYQLFYNRLQKPQNSESMNIDEIKKRKLFTNAATDADVFRIIDGLETEAAKVPGLSSEVQDLTGKLKVFTDKAETEATAAKKQLLEDAIADGRINETTRPTYQALLDKDLENGKVALAAIPAKKRIVNQLNPEEPTMGAWEKRQQEIRNQSKK